MQDIIKNINRSSKRNFDLISCGLAFYFVITDTDEPTQFYGFLTVWFFYFLLIKAPEKNIT